MTSATALAPPDLSAQNREQGFLTLSTGRVHYRLEGHGPFLVLNHGYGANLHMWTWQWEALGHHFRLLTWDMPGFGKSQGISAAHGVEDFARVQAELMTALGIPEAHVLGLSLGGMVALPFASLYPQMTKSLLLCDTVHTRIPAAGRLIFSLFEMRGNMKNANIDWVGRLEHLDKNPNKSRFGIPQDHRMAHLRVLSQHEDGNATARAAQVVSKKACYEWALKEIKKPVLVVVGTEDVLYNYSIDMVKVQPKSRLVVMEGVNHGTAAIHPHGFNKAVLRFLQEVEAGQHPEGMLYLPDGNPHAEFETRELSELENLFEKPDLMGSLPHVVDRLVWALLR